jgi:hypothetical protein
MIRLLLRGALIAPLLAACGGPQPLSFSRGAGSAPIGTDASTGQPAVSARGLGPGGINRGYNTGGDPNFPESSSSGRR